MPRLIITSRLGAMMSRMPHRIYVNGQLIGVMNTQSVRIEMPAGVYSITIQSVVPFLSSTQQVTLRSGIDTHLDFYSRERVWDILFSIDLLLCIIKLFLTFPTPWNWIYEVATNGFFIVWLIYEWSIRKHYYKTSVSDSLP
ncbi:MAG: hypothetical protein IJR13_05425 [Bacteroidales bacterium]|nr:hypothetical protein [Bacteroidales bacterium]